MAIRVMVVEDSDVVRAGIVAIFGRDARFEVVATAASAAEALDLLGSARPSVALLDHRLPDTLGSKLCKEILARAPEVAVVMLTGFDSDEVIRTCLAAGARGFLTKDIDDSDLLAGVMAAAEGRTYLSPRITERLVVWARSSRYADSARSLEQEEIDILGLVARGMSNKQVAGELCLSESSVKTRLQTAMRKLGTSKRADAVAAGMKRGVI
jgi:DNA-binding NarL/FixJ family response regulator